jgi:hypothetical protein
LWILARVLFNLTNPKTGDQKQLVEELGHKEWRGYNFIWEELCKLHSGFTIGKPYTNMYKILPVFLGYISDWKTNLTFFAMELLDSNTD